jgi:hypothetical protein
MGIWDAATVTCVLHQLNGLEVGQSANVVSNNLAVFPSISSIYSSMVFYFTPYSSRELTCKECLWTTKSGFHLL